MFLFTDYSSATMWEDAPPHIVNYLRRNAVSYNNHKKAVTPKVKINLINE